MFDWKLLGRRNQCQAYRAQIEERVCGGNARIQPGSALDAHIAGCAFCRQALEDAVLASRLMQNAQAPAPQPSEAFVTRVMATIRSEVVQQAVPGAFWRPLEIMASRFAVAATVALLALSLYAVRLAQPARPAATATVQNQTEDLGAGIPERPTLPSNQDDVLMSLASQGQGLE